MKLPTLAALVCLAATGPAMAAPKQHLVIDHSSPALMDKATAMAVWNQHLTARVVKLYPVAKWGFSSQVEGGFDESKTCVVTARAMMLPRAGKVLQFVPNKGATAFASQAGASLDQCRALARTKLDQVVVAVRSSLLAN